ncbi:hypothetical protein [Streptomyces sp. NBC_00035]|uniref:hypothetical protein n=1 Tax=Streptomyces sp. NBC_00035 TaxID=2903614 RepID=UPI0032528139
MNTARLRAVTAPVGAFAAVTGRTSAAVTGRTSGAVAAPCGSGAAKGADSAGAR